MNIKITARILTVGILFLVSTGVWACPDFNGKYTSIDLQPELNLEIRQKGCEEIHLSYSGAESVQRNLILDGKKRKETENREMIMESSYRWQGNEVQMQQTTRWKSDGTLLFARGTLGWNGAGEWLEATDFSDAQGNSLGRTEQNFKKRLFGKVK
jgi:hypothetical protein